jgi:hypothetical protein
MPDRPTIKTHVHQKEMRAKWFATVLEFGAWAPLGIALVVPIFSFLVEKVCPGDSPGLFFDKLLIGRDFD